MTGVIAFYSALFESTIEKKLVVYNYNIVPRFTKKKLIYVSKLIKFKQQKKNYFTNPNKNVRLLINNSN
jgi:hypothetical protein